MNTAHSIYTLSQYELDRQLIQRRQPHYEEVAYLIRAFYEEKCHQYQAQGLIREHQITTTREDIDSNTPFREVMVILDMRVQVFMAINGWHRVRINYVLRESRFEHFCSFMEPRIETGANYTLQSAAARPEVRDASGDVISRESIERMREQIETVNGDDLRALAPRYFEESRVTQPADQQAGVFMGIPVVADPNVDDVRLVGLPERPVFRIAPDIANRMRDPRSESSIRQNPIFDRMRQAVAAAQRSGRILGGNQRQVDDHRFPRPFNERVWAARRSSRAMDWFDTRPDQRMRHLDEAIRGRLYTQEEIDLIIEAYQLRPEEQSFLSSRRRETPEEAAERLRTPSRRLRPRNTPDPEIPEFQGVTLENILSWSRGIIYQRRRQVISILPHPFDGVEWLERLNPDHRWTDEDGSVASKVREIGRAVRGRSYSALEVRAIRHCFGLVGQQCRALDYATRPETRDEPSQDDIVDAVRYMINTRTGQDQNDQEFRTRILGEFSPQREPHIRVEPNFISNCLDITLVEPNGERLMGEFTREFVEQRGWHRDPIIQHYEEIRDVLRSMQSQEAAQELTGTRTGRWSSLSRNIQSIDYGNLETRIAAVTNSLFLDNAPSRDDLMRIAELYGISRGSIPPSYSNEQIRDLVRNHLEEHPQLRGFELGEAIYDEWDIDSEPELPEQYKMPKFGHRRIIIDDKPKDKK